MAKKANNVTTFTSFQVAKNMKNILILGGTGAMGTHLLGLLAARGDQVSVTTRRHLD